MRKKTSAAFLAKQLRISKTRASEAIVKAKMISALLRASERKGLTHAEIAKRSGVPRSAVTGILSGSMQKVTIDRLLRLLEAVDLQLEIQLRDAA